MDGMYEPGKVLRDLDVNSSPSKRKIQNGKGEDSPSDEYSDNEFINDQMHSIKFEIEGLGSLDAPSPSSRSKAQTENLAVIDDSCSSESQLDYSGEEHDLDHMISESISTIPFSISPGLRQDSPLSVENSATNEAELEAMRDQDDENSTSTDIDEEEMDIDSDNVPIMFRGNNNDAAIEAPDDDTTPNKKIYETPQQLSAFTFYHIPSPVSTQDRDTSHDIDYILMPPPPPRQINTIVSSKKKRKRGRRRSDAVDLTLSHRDSDDRPVVKLSKHLENTYHQIRSNALNVPVQQLYQGDSHESDSEIQDLQNSYVAQDFSNPDGDEICKNTCEAKSGLHNEECHQKKEVALEKDEDSSALEEAYEYSFSTFESECQSRDSKRVVSQGSSDEDEDINMNGNEKSTETCKIVRHDHDNENCSENADQVNEEENQSENDTNSCEVDSEVEFDKPSITARFSDIIGHGAAKLRLDEMLLPLALPPTISRNVLVGKCVPCPCSNSLEASILKLFLSFVGIRAVPASILFYGPPGEYFSLIMLPHGTCRISHELS